MKLLKKIFKKLFSIFITILNSFKAAHPYNYISLRNSSYSLLDLLNLDKSYKKMQKNHYSVHKRMIEQINNKKNKKILEVACGTGWNVKLFQDRGFDYYGLDISDTALAVAILKHPEYRYFNLDITDTFIFKDDTFDVVYNSAMLEHIGFYKEAINEMVRIAKNEVYIIFFEGLSFEKQNSIKFIPYTKKDITGKKKNIFGRKVILQNHIHNEKKGWYWNHYSRKQIVDLMNKMGYQYKILDNTNTDFINKESVLIIKK